ncbi:MULTISPECIES: BolA family transcriptional regulator [unclassified Methylobacterium]|uniref:BolA family protein n=1 Tax=unclassified Methylobacterium TaxID=2615210 RepID=UPI0006F8D797|nr:MULTISPECIES: BolA family protein [unclassified Methylobacterium]KQO49228.1 BolA family transcriptional regulator [Methylobacterium sp. Leaf86]KQP00547.1 BolA family transcriptional regulator [Methylobacterium sp. Leaf91]MBO1020873.1 BolA family transcriptional regulator [Methylobacterium sp. SD274]
MAGTLKDWITGALDAQLAPQTLVVVDESHLHAGHSGARPEGETHFRVEIVSAAFEGKSRVERHRIVNGVLDEAFKRGLHALAVKAKAPSEAA